MSKCLVSASDYRKHWPHDAQVHSNYRPAVDRGLERRQQTRVRRIAKGGHRKGAR